MCILFDKKSQKDFTLSAEGGKIEQTMLDGASVKGVWTYERRRS
jgi:hypothetical protein